MTAYLLDTNCFIQLIRQRPEAPQVQMLLQDVPQAQLYMTVTPAAALQRFTDEQKQRTT
jgi:predicted nucleic acid-binding protein